MEVTRRKFLGWVAALAAAVQTKPVQVIAGSLTEVPKVVLTTGSSGGGVFYSYLLGVGNARCRVESEGPMEVMEEAFFEGGTLTMEQSSVGPFDIPDLRLTGVRVLERTVSDGPRAPAGAALFNWESA